MTICKNVLPSFEIPSNSLTDKSKVTEKMVLIFWLKTYPLIVVWFNVLMDGGVSRILWFLITSWGGKPYSSLNSACCTLILSEEKDGPMCPNTTYAMMMIARDKPITNMLNATPFMWEYPPAD